MTTEQVVLSLADIQADIGKVEARYARSVDFEMFLNQLIAFDRLASLCQHCSNHMDPTLQQDFQDVFVEVVILCYAGVQSYFDADMDICAKVFNNRLPLAPKVEAELARILGTSAISQTFNLDQVFRQMFINVIEGSKPKPKPKFKSKPHSPSTAKEQSGKRGLDGPSDGTPATKDEGVVDPPPRKKPLLKLQSPKKEKKLRPRNRELPPVAHPNAANPLAGRLGCIMAAVVQGRKGAAKKVIQVRPVAVLSEAFVRVEDAWPRDATTPSYWELRNTSLVDYLGLQHSAADFQEGDLVYSLFKLDAGMSSEFYGGRVTAVAADTVTVQFEDADQQMVRYDQLLRLADFGANHGLKIPTFEIN